MLQAVMRFGALCVLAIGVAAPAHAQQGPGNANAQQRRERRQPNQVPDNGAGQSDAAAADNTFERVVDNVPVTVRADGTIVVELDDSFMEAQTATIEADGSLRYDHVTGLERAAAFVRRQTAPKTSAMLPARALPLIFPIYEVK
jgi:hypothetical protein